MFSNFSKILLGVFICSSAFLAASCAPSLKAISYKDAVYKLTESNKNTFTYTNSNNETIICTFNSNVFYYNNFTLQMGSDLYKVSMFGKSCKIVFPTGRALTTYYNDKYELTTMTSPEKLYPATDAEVVDLALRAYAARGIKYIGWVYIAIISAIMFFAYCIWKITGSNTAKSTYRAYGKKRYYAQPGYSKYKRSFYNNDYYKKRPASGNVYTNTDRRWYNKDVKTKSNKMYYAIINIVILVLIGALIYMVFYM